MSSAGSEGDPDRLDPRLRRSVRSLAVAGAVGVVLYIGSWILAGALWDGYDPVRQAISELFATDAPRLSAGLLEFTLPVTGLLLTAFAWVLHRVLPGHGIAGPTAVAVAGIATFVVAFVPCSPGCPGAGTTTSDTWHTVVAGGGYAALAVAPLLFAWRCRRVDPRLAGISLAFGLAACTGFAVYIAGPGVGIGGAIQRTFNTTADAWLLVMAVVVWRRVPRVGGRRGPR